MITSKFGTQLNCFQFYLFGINHQGFKFWSQSQFLSWSLILQQMQSQVVKSSKT